MSSDQPGTVASRMIVFKKAGTITGFSFDAGEGLSEHTAPYDAVLMVTDGTAEVQIAGTPFTVGAGGDDNPAGGQAARGLRARTL